MVFVGTIKKSGKLWIVEVPQFEAITQAHTKAECFGMIRDWFVSIINDNSAVQVQPMDTDKFIVKLEPTPKVFGLLLQRQRLKSGLSIREAAKILGFKSANSYASYEQGNREPSISVAARLMKAVSKQDQLDLGFLTCS